MREEQWGNTCNSTLNIAENLSLGEFQSYLWCLSPWTKCFQKHTRSNLQADGIWWFSFDPVFLENTARVLGGGECVINPHENIKNKQTTNKWFQCHTVGSSTNNCTSSMVFTMTILTQFLRSCNRNVEDSLPRAWIISVQNNQKVQNELRKHFLKWQQLLLRKERKRVRSIRALNFIAMNWLLELEIKKKETLDSKLQKLWGQIYESSHRFIERRFFLFFYFLAH